jgi:hypothetical protein
MTLDKHQIDGIGGFNQKILPAGEFEELMTSAGYSISIDDLTIDRNNGARMQASRYNYEE